MRLLIAMLVAALVASAQVVPMGTLTPGAFRLPKADSTGYISWSWLNPGTPVFTALSIGGAGTAGCVSAYGTDGVTHSDVCANTAGTALTIAGQPPVSMFISTPTLAQINAGTTIMAGIAGTQLRVIGVLISVAGTFATCTDVRLSDTGGTPVDITTFAVAGLAGGNKLGETSASTTLGAGFLAALTAGNGIKVRQTGTACTGGTSIVFRVLYTTNY